VVAAGFGVRNAWRMRSWDRFCVPKPFSLATCVAAPPLTVPADAGAEELEHYRQKLENTLLHVTGLAERWAETGAAPTLSDGQQGLESLAPAA
jgi:hypothetical protein